MFCQPSYYRPCIMRVTFSLQHVPSEKGFTIRYFRCMLKVIVARIPTKCSLEVIRESSGPRGGKMAIRNLFALRMHST